MQKSTNTHTVSNEDAWAAVYMCTSLFMSSCIIHMYSQSVCQLDCSTQSTNMLLAFYISIHLHTHTHTHTHVLYIRTQFALKASSTDRNTSHIDFKEAMKST